MTTKELIQVEIASVPEEELERLYEWIKSFNQLRPKDDGRSFMSKLLSIQFDGPEDLASNHDLYFTGEKCEEPDIH